MTGAQLVTLALDLCQFSVGAWFVWKGWKMTAWKWDRTQMEFHVGHVIVGIGFIIIFLLRVR